MSAGTTPGAARTLGVESHAVGRLSMPGRRNWRGGRWASTFLPGVTLALSVLAGPVAIAQSPNQFGGQDRADAAQQLIVLAVQQGISALPPMAGQAFSYEYDRDTDTYVRSSLLGPTALRSPRPIGAGRLGIRLTGSYFDLGESFGPTGYRIDLADPAAPATLGFAGFGLQASASVGVFNLTASYGITNTIDVGLVLPIVIVDAQGSQSFTTDATRQREWPPVLAGGTTAAALAMQLRRGTVVYRRESFRTLGFDFNDGPHAGVGRITLGGRAALYASERLRCAFATDLYLPSPNENQFAGSATTSILPRAIAEVGVMDHLRLLADVGYDYDFNSAQLRRFVGTGGLLVPFTRWSVDLGISGSIYDTPITWTPGVAYAPAGSGYPATVIVAQGDTTVGSNYVDFLFGVKGKLTDSLVLSGAVTVPLNDAGVRPAAAGTVALEQWF